MRKAVESIALRESRKADQNDHPTRPQPMATPEAYPQGYVEDVVEGRTKLGIVFISLMISG